MGSYILRRVLATIPVVAFVMLFVYSLLYVTPGDPAAILAGDQASQAEIEAIRTAHGKEGASELAVLFIHALRNASVPIVTVIGITLVISGAVVIDRAGLPTSIPSWGNIMAEGRALWQVKPNIAFFPAIFLSITVLAVNLLADGLRDAVDPRPAKRV